MPNGLRPVAGRSGEEDNTSVSASWRSLVPLAMRRRKLPRPPKHRNGGGRAPDYVGIGVQRAGTTRWDSLIRSHPDAAPIVDWRGRLLKETHWFNDQRFDATPAHAQAYAAWFQAPEDKVVGEFTPRYLYDRWPLDQLRSYYPDVKLLVLLREPVSRLASALRFYEQIGIALDEATVDECIDRGVYGPQLEYLFSIWPREQVLVLLHEDCNERPHEMLSQTYQFLGLDADFVPETIDTVSNASTQLDVDQGVLHRAALIYERDHQRLSNVLPNTDLSSWGG